jgi:hypothetical protein
VRMPRDRRSTQPRHVMAAWVTASRRRSNAPGTPPRGPLPGGVRAVLKPVVALAGDGPAARRHERGYGGGRTGQAHPRSIPDLASGAPAVGGAL